MAGDSGEKTEKATPKKRRDQRKEGNVFQSKDVVTVVSLFGSFYILKLLFPKIYETVRAFMIDFIGFAGTVTDTSQGKINEILAQVDREAERKKEKLIQQMLEKEPMPEREDALDRAAHMEMLIHQAEEIILFRIVYRLR